MHRRVGCGASGLIVGISEGASLPNFASWNPLLLLAQALSTSALVTLYFVYAGHVGQRSSRSLKTITTCYFIAPNVKTPFPISKPVYDALEGLLGCDASTYCELLLENPDLPEYVREGIQGLMCHLLVREKREGQSSDSFQVLDGIIPADPSSFEPILVPYLSNEQLAASQSQRLEEDSSSDEFYDA
ncbi:hypothetical protein O0I10_001672 [Lichtheimia ornata]|uniref:Uncharacterized protein n=1 Tax=Lichtheimia ornata TaxID=688661 RepID=A0AAD7Y2G7_9FUNG|nr:uncharacterized protein O0I10_001672 [Lichtheimia ornata]KAJ8662708.1 hypothetical protein O0I10_001672 [Lichtheimia ornata]